MASGGLLAALLLIFNKILRLAISEPSSAINPCETDAIELCFSQFETVSLSEVRDIIFHLKCSFCPNDTVSLRILNDGSDIASLSILSNINSLK